MDKQLEQQATALICDYQEEIDHWDAVPIRLVWSRERLSKFLHYDAPRLLIERELTLLRKRLIDVRTQRAQRDRMLQQTRTVH